MSESLLDHALTYSRSRLELLEASPRTVTFGARLDVLERASASIALEGCDIHALVRVVRLALDLRDEIVSVERQSKASRARALVRKPAIAS